MSLIPGFSFEERMAGTYHLLDAPGDERPIELTLGARAPSLGRFMRRPIATARGEADLEGFADHKPARGTIKLDLLVGRMIGYDFEFTGNDGLVYRFRGQKDVELLRLKETMAFLPAALYDSAGRIIGKAEVRFHYESDLLRFVRSWRLT